MYFDFKMTVWERVEVPEEFEKAIAAKIRNGEITSTYDIIKGIEETDSGSEESFSTIDDTECYLTPENKGGAGTIEIMEPDKKGIHNSTWDNCEKIEINT